MAVTVRSRAGVPGRLRLRGDASRLLQALGEADAELSVSLVGDAAMRRLNHAYRGKDRATDVLAFAMREGPRAAGDEALLGDVVISVDTARRQARQHGVSLAEELRTLLIHGVLHLLGYDHERSRTEARRMQAMQRRLRQVLTRDGCTQARRRTA